METPKPARTGGETVQKQTGFSREMESNNMC